MNYFPSKNSPIDEPTFVSELPVAPSKNCEASFSKSHFSNVFRKTLLNRMDNLRDGLITVLQRDHEPRRLGSSETSKQFESTVVVRRPEFFRKIVLGGTIGSAESYVSGDWDTDDLTSLIRIIIRNLDQMTNLEKTWGRVKNRWYWFQHLLRRNSINGSQRNIHEHYDLGNDFYQLFLDSTMNYSSGIFTNLPDEAGDELENASIRKMRRICEKLQLKAEDHVLEIGTGWGGLAIFMAREYDCQVTTTTISKEQYCFAVDAVEQAGLQDRIQVIKKDYRKLTGQFDKIVSVEMIEAVGHQYYDTYFETCSNLLTDSGIMLLQAITMSEQNYEYHIRHVDFIRRYVFPGGSLPSIVALSRSVGKMTDMRMLHTEDITEHYVRTLQFWRQAFLENLDRVQELGYPEAFTRMWHFYLCYCEAAFAERRVHNVHLVYCKPQCKIDPTVDYRFEDQLAPGEISRQQIHSDEIICNT